MIDLKNNGYVLQNHIWVNPESDKFNYSDGDEVENRIAKIINEANDLSSLSDELELQINDWPSLYYLDKRRGNLIRPFKDNFKNKKILEVGAGCGSVTRVLGEIGAEVLALEGSKRRAQICKSRCRDLHNVDVICENINNFQCDITFDYIVMVGVFEYANLFITNTNNAQNTMLEKCKKMLNKNGQIIIAIENKLGIKYFAGAKEDHLSAHSLGIEGRYNNRTVRTFSKLELTNILKMAGFEYCSFFAPFPDYKTPNTIISEQGFANELFDTNSLVINSFRKDYQLPRTLNFSPELCWDSIEKEQIQMNFANSFLIFAGQTPIDNNILAAHYSVNGRKNEFAKEKIFYELGGKINVSAQILGTTKNNNSNINHRVIPHEQYEYGANYADYLYYYYMREADNFEVFCMEFAKFYNFLLGKCQLSAQEINENTKIDGSFFDFTIFNTIKNENHFSIIDQEWEYKYEIPLFYVLYRSVSYFIARIGYHGKPMGVENNYEFIKKLYEYCGLNVSFENCVMFQQLENTIQNFISVAKRDLNFELHTHTGEYIVYNMYNTLQGAHNELQGSYNQLQAEHNQLQTHPSELPKNNNLQNEYNILLQNYNKILESKSWRITRPLRVFMRLLRGQPLK